MLQRLSLIALGAVLALALVRFAPSTDAQSDVTTFYYPGLTEFVWSGASTPIATALDGIDYTAVFHWNNPAQEWSTARPGVPGTLTRFTPNRIYWIASPSGGSLDIGGAPDAGATGVPTDFPLGNGVWIVGLDVAPDTYRITPGPDGCYWARLTGFSGEFEDIITNDIISGPSVVTIQPTDAGFDPQCF